MHQFLRRFGLPIIIIVLVISRFVILPFSPPGFYIDEAATGAHVVAMLQHGTDGNGVPNPLFASSLGDGYTTGVYLYPLVAWAALFGTSELALRAFSQCVTILAIVVIGLALRLWIGRKYGWVAMIVGLALPWGWLQGSLAWDPAMVPLFVALAFLGFSLVWFSRSQKQMVIGQIILPLALILAAYVYPPCRVSAPLLFVIAYGVLLWRRKMTWRPLVITLAGSAIISLPLALFMFQPDALERSGALSVFHDQSLLAGVGSFLMNELLLLNPAFLFYGGDANLRHSTQFEGMLGFGAFIPILVLLVVSFRSRHLIRSAFQRPRVLLVILAVIGILVADMGSALTNEGQPHSLRATAAWPFFVILLTVGWTIILEAKGAWLRRVAIGILFVGTILYAIDLAFFYPPYAAEGFDTLIRQKIMTGQPVQYAPLARSYYQNR